QPHRPFERGADPVGQEQRVDLRGLGGARDVGVDVEVEDTLGGAVRQAPGLVVGADHEDLQNQDELSLVAHERYSFPKWGRGRTQAGDPTEASSSRSRGSRYLP